MNIRGAVIEVGDLDGFPFAVVIIQSERNILAQPENGCVLQQVHVISEADFKELEAYRQGGLTEELLRKQDGYIRVGHGCVLVSESLFKALANKGAE